MKRQLFRRMLACLLALLLLPVPAAFAEEPETVLMVVCHDVFREGKEKTVSVLEKKDGYYITFDDAIRMAGLILSEYDGDGEVLSSCDTVGGRLTLAETQKNISLNG